MNARSAAPIVAGGAVLAVALLALFGLLGIVTGSLGAALALVAPGAAIGAALFPRGTLDRAERILVTLVGSIVVAILLGFLLTRVGIRLTPLSWAVALMLVTLVAAAAAIARAGRAWTIRLPDRIELPAVRSLPRLDLALVGLAVVVALSAAGIARLGATAQPQPGFSQLWLLPEAGNAVRVGVRDEESGPASYHLVLRGTNGTITEWRDVRLAPGERWERSVAVPTAARAGLELLLYRSDSPGTVYRRVGLPAGTTPRPSAASPATSPRVQPSGSAAPSPTR